MSLDYEDATGQAPSLKDIEDALQAVHWLITHMPQVMTALPPQVLVNIPNMRRCLMELARLRAGQVLVEKSDGS